MKSLFEDTQKNLGYNNNKMKTKRSFFKILISWAVVLIWMGLIFSFSTQDGSHSSRLSEKFTAFILNIITRVAPSSSININLLHLIVRKTAHFSIYLFLGFFVTNAVNPSGNRTLWTPILFCLLYALSDECHQYFVPERVFSLIDIVIDSIGSLTGILIYHCFKSFFKRVSAKKNKPTTN